MSKDFKDKKDESIKDQETDGQQVSKEEDIIKKHNESTAITASDVTNSIASSMQAKEVNDSNDALKIQKTELNKISDNAIQKTLNSDSIKPVTYSTYSGYQQLSSLKTSFHDVSSSYQVFLTTEVQHFFRIFISNDAGSPTHLKSTLINSQEEGIPLMSESNKAFQDGIKLALLGIDCNRTGANFKLNPFEKDLIQLDATNNELSALKKCLEMSTFSLYGNASIIQYLVVAAYVARVSGFIGNFRYITSSTVFEKFKQYSESTSVSDFKSAPKISLNTTVLDPKSAEFYYGRIGSQSIDILSDLHNIVNDDYSRYLRFEMLRRYLPTEWLRQLASQLEKPKLSSVPNSALSFAGSKIGEIAETGMDVVMATLQANGLSYLDTLKINRDNILKLVCNMFFKRDDILANENQDVTFYTLVTLFENDISKHIDFTTYPHSPIHTHAFRVVPVMSSACLVRMFSFLSTHALKYLSTVVFLSTDDIYSTITGPEASLVNPALPARISQMTSQLSAYSVNPETLSYKMVLDLLSPYNLVSSVAAQNQVVFPDFLPFCSEYLGMLISKHMYYNTWSRNRYAYYSQVREFFFRWFGTPKYQLLEFDNFYGFGTCVTGVNTVKLNYKTGVTRREDIVTTYTYSKSGPDFFPGDGRSLLALVRNNLCLSSNAIAVVFNTNHGPYGISERKIRIPGSCYAPVISTTSPPLPIVAILHTFYNVSLEYHRLLDNCTTKGSVSAAMAVLLKFYPPIARFAQFFHCIYCPSYLALARSPFLLHDDVELHEENYKFWFGLVDTDPAGAQTAFVDSVFHYNAVQPFGAPQISESINLLFAASPPGVFKAEGHNYSAATDCSSYGMLYKSYYPVEAFQFYTGELMRRHQLFEAVGITAKMADGSFLEGMPTVAAAISNNYHTIGIPMISWIYLGSTLQNTLTSEDSVVSGYNTDYTKTFLPEMRLRKPSLGTMLPNGTIYVLPYKDCTRPVVYQNSTLLFKYFFGDYAIRPLLRGLSLSYQTLPTPLLFRTPHSDASILINVSNDVFFNQTVQNNMISTIVVTCSTIGPPPTYTQTFHVSPEDPKSLISAIKAFSGFSLSYLPYFKLVLNNRPTNMSTQAVKFLYQLYSSSMLLIHFNHIYTYLFYSIKSPSQAMESSPLNETEFSTLFNATNASLIPVESIDTRYTTSSFVGSVTQRNVLAITPWEPTVLAASGLSGQSRSTGLPTIINQDLFPKVSKQNAYTQMALDTAGKPVNMLTNYPYSLTSRSEVIAYPPFTVDSLNITTYV